MEPLKELLISREEMQKKMESIVRKAKQLFRIEQGTGRIIFEKVEKLTDTQKVGLLLVGKYLAKELEQTDKSALSSTEMAEEIYRPRKVLSAGKGPIKELLKRGLIEQVTPRKYQIIYYHIEDVLDDALEKLKKG